MLLQVNFIGKWRLKNKPNYVWTTCKKLINTKTGKMIVKTTNGRGSQVGYYIDRKFTKLKDLRDLLEQIPAPLSPFH